MAATLEPTVVFVAECAECLPPAAALRALNPPAVVMLASDAAVPEAAVPNTVRVAVTCCCGVEDNSAPLDTPAIRDDAHASPIDVHRRFVALAAARGGSATVSADYLLACAGTEHWLAPFHASRCVRDDGGLCAALAETAVVDDKSDDDAVARIFARQLPPALASMPRNDPTVAEILAAAAQGPVALASRHALGTCAGGDGVRDAAAARRPVLPAVIAAHSLAELRKETDGAALRGAAAPPVLAMAETALPACLVADLKAADAACRAATSRQDAARCDGAAVCFAERLLAGAARAPPQPHRRTRHAPAVPTTHKLLRNRRERVPWDRAARFVARIPVSAVDALPAPAEERALLEAITLQMSRGTHA